MPVWDEVSPEQVALLNQFESLVFDPQHPQPYFETGQVALLEQSRYCSPDLRWGWRSDKAIYTQVPIEFLQHLNAQAAILIAGEEVRTGNGTFAGTLRRFPTIEERGVVTNFHPALKVKLSGTNQRTSGVVQGVVDWERYPDDFDFAMFAAPFRLMKRSWSEEFGDFLATLRIIVPMAPDTRAKAFTVSSHQGAIFVTPHDELRMFEMLLHEKAHVKQRHINDIWPLLEAEQSAERFIVPWRPDPRPIHGIFEGIYVFLQVAVGFARLGPLCVPTAEERARVLMNHLKVGLEIIGEHARMTPAGLEFFEGVSKAWRANGEFLGCDF